MTEPLPASGRQAIADLTLYLRDAGWTRAEARNTWLWTPLDGEHAALQVALPKRGDVVDLEQQLNEAARVVAFVQGLTVAEVWSGTLGGGADTLSVRLSPNAESGSAPLGLAQESLAALRKLLVGATAALNNDALVLPSRRPQVVEDYAADALVSTRPGSFVVDVALPLMSDAKVPTAQGILMPNPSLPLGRLVSSRLRLVAQNALLQAQRIADDQGDISAFRNPQNALGNSLELDGLAHLSGDVGADYQLRITQSARAPRSERPVRMRATQSQREQLAAAADYLRSIQSLEGVTLEGYVSRLARERRSGSGDVTIRAVLDDSGKAKTCVMSLASEDYAEALRAHNDGLPVHVRGDLSTAGNNRKYLRNPSGFRVIDPSPRDSRN